MANDHPAEGVGFDDLFPLARRLNTASDDLNAALKGIEDRLNQLGLGIARFVPLPNTREVIHDRDDREPEEFVEYQVGYDRLGESWALMTRRAHFADSNDPDDTIDCWQFDDEKPLLRSSRELRIEAVAAIPGLLKELKSGAEAMLQVVEDAKRIAGHDEGTQAVVKIKSLSPEMDVEFSEFYQAVFRGASPDADGFDAAARSFFDSQGGDAGKVDDFFNNFTPVWTTFLAQGRNTKASSIWEWALRPAREWERISQSRLHKGTAFYFSAMTAILAGDLDAGYLYAHQAFEEDRLTHGVALPATPSLSLVCMDPDNVDQAFRGWVVEKSEFLTRALDQYRSRHGRQLDFRDTRTKLLTRADLAEATFLLSYSVARLKRLEAIGRVGFSSEFAGQLASNILFDVTLVTDAVIRKASGLHGSFIDLAAELSSRANLQLSNSRLRKINGLFQQDFEQTLIACLDETVRLDDGFDVKGLAAALALTYGCRNRAAHDVSAVTVIRDRFEEVRQAVLDSLFLAVEIS